MLKKMFILIGIIIVFCTFLTGQSYAQEQDNPQLKIVSGKITDLFGPYAFLRAEDSKEYEVFIGPPWFLMDRDVFLRIGDRIKVIGEIEEYRGLSTVYPYSLQFGDEKINFTDNEGYALWDYRGYRNYSGFSYYRNRLPRRYLNRPYGFRDDGGYYRSYRRDQRFDRGLFREDNWRINGETGWMSGRRWRGYGCPYRGLSRDYYYTPRKNYPYRYRYYREY